jgi:CheY-like chemotaxis protein
MPEMDGVALAEEIARHPEHAGARIVLLTSAACRGDGARCREIGIRAYLTKPFKPRDLLDTLCRVLEPEVGAGEPALITQHSLRESRPRLRILLAEDNEVNQLLAVRLLEKEGHEVVVVGTGLPAVDALARARVDLVLMDIQMPEMDGLAATRAVRERELGTGRRVPIIAMTAHAMKGDRELCLEAGMDGYVSKPIRPAALWVEIERATGSLPSSSHCA